MKIGQFPYQLGGNPYQLLFSNSLEGVGIKVERIRPRKIFPLHFALSHEIDLLHLDWPHDWYSGKSKTTTYIKRLMYFRGLRKLRKVPCVWTAHNLAGHDAVDINDEKRMIQALIDCCDGIMVMSHAAEKQLFDTYRLDSSTIVKVIPHGHFVDVYQNVVSQTDARVWLDLHDASRVVLSLGRILPYKGIDELIGSFSQVAQKGDVLIVAGQAADEAFLEDLKKLANQSCPSHAKIIIKPEYIPDEHLQYYFNASDIVALPFKEILNSASLLLAMSFGRCVVAPKIGSIPEVACPSGLFGYCKNDQLGLATAIEAALSCSNRTAREKEILRFTVENYGWKQIGSKVHEMYDAIMYAGRNRKVS